MFRRTLAVLLIVVFVGNSECQGKGWEPVRQCEKLTVKHCEDMPYNYTFADLSSISGAQSQFEVAETRFKIYQIWIESKSPCSAYLRFFLCTKLFPMCSRETGEAIYTCRDICDEVKSRCESFLHSVSFDWPKELECSQFKKPGELCIEKDPRFMDSRGPESIRISPTVAVTTTAPLWTRCPPKFVAVADGERTVCLPRCSTDVRFTQNEKKILEIIIAVFGTFGFLSGIFVLLTVSISIGRFQYPARPVVWIAACFMMTNVGYLIRVFGGHEISCEKGNDTALRLTWNGVGKNGLCTMQFLFTYFFFNAGCLWWLMLTISWFLSTSRKWSCEAILSCRIFFHAIAWSIPLLLTSCILILQKIDADELSGMCGVGNFDKQNLLHFIIIPNIFYLFSGGILSVYGIISGIRTKNHFLKSNGKNNDVTRLTALILKIGLLSFAFIICLSLFLSSGFVEYFLWDENSKIENSKIGNLKIDDSKIDGLILRFPFVTTPVFYLRVLLPLILSLLTGFWIFNRKTLKTWLEFCSKPFMNKQKKSTSDQQGTRTATIPSPLIPLLSPGKTPFSSPTCTTVA